MTNSREKIGGVNDSPEITCVVPSFENVPLLSRCLLSILTQERVKTDVIVCDDSRSEDPRKFVELLVSRYPQMRYMRGARSGNPVDNWNFGLDAAKTDCCIIVHHDEFLVDPMYLRKALDRLHDQGVAAVVGRCAVVGIRRAARFPLARAVMRAVHAPLWTLYVANWIGPTATVIFRKSRGIRFDPSLVYLVDVDFYYRMLSESTTLHFLNEVSVVSLGHHTAQISAKCDVLRRSLDELRYICRLKRAGLSRMHGALLTGFAWIRNKLSSPR